MMENSSLTNVEHIEHAILLIRGHRVILDSNLAQVYGVETKALVRQVRRNIERFPPDFAFRLTQEEVTFLKSNFSIAPRDHGGRRYLPYAFTEHGAVMAANVLRSKRAVKASIFVVRTFVKLRQLLASHKEFAEKFDELERTVATHDKAIVSLFDAIRKLMNPPVTEKKKIGFDL